HFSSHRLGRHAAIGAQRDGHDDQISGGRCLSRRGGARLGAELFDELCERLGSSRVAEHHVITSRDGQARDGATDQSAANQADSLHSVLLAHGLSLVKVFPMLHPIHQSAMASIALAIFSILDGKKRNPFAARRTQESTAISSRTRL